MILHASSAILLGSLALWQSGAVTSESELKDRFFSEYPIAVSKLESASSHAHCKAGFEMKAIGEFRETVIEKEIFSNGRNELALEFFKVSKGHSTSNEVVLCWTPDYYFQLDRSEAGKPFRVSNVSGKSLNVNDIQDELYLKMSVHCYMISRSAYSISGVPMKMVFDDPSLKILKVSELADSNNPRRVIVKFSCSGQSHWILGGEVAFVPELNWAIRHFDVEVAGDRPGMTSGVPKGTRCRGSILCKRWSGDNVFPEEGEFRYVYPVEPYGPEPLKAFKVTEAQFEIIPHRQFTLGAFGLPDSLLQPKSHASPLKYWLFGSAFLCLIGAIFVRFILLRRSETHEAKS